jgi:hypothetical protein
VDRQGDKSYLLKGIQGRKYFVNPSVIYENPSEKF